MARRKSALHRFEDSVLRSLSGILDAVAHFKKTDNLSLDRRLIRAVEPIADWLFTDYWRVQTLGAKNIPARGRALIVANHSGALPFDGAMLHLAVRRRHSEKRFVRFLVDDFVFRQAFLAEVMQRLGGVRASPEGAHQLLAREELVAVFPEGVKGLGKLFRDRYQLARFGRGGFVRVAAETGTPVIPCAIVGAEEIYPILWKSEELAAVLNVPYVPVTPTFPLLGPLGLIPLPSQWVIAFGPAICVPRTVAKNPQKIDAWSHRIRAVIQRMLATLLKARQSVWEF